MNYKSMNVGMYPLWQLFSRIPILRYDIDRVAEILRARSSRRVSWMRTNAQRTGQFKSPGQRPRGPQFGRQPFHGGQAYQYPHAGYPGTPGTPGHPGMERRMSSAGSEGDSFLQAPGDESYDYQQLASDDSRDTQHSVGDGSQPQAGFHGAFGNGGSQQEAQDQQQSSEGGGQAGDASGGSGPPQSPPDIKYEVTPMPFMKTNDFELIEIDPDEEDDI